MSRVAIVTDSNSGISQAEAKEKGIYVMPMPFTIDGVDYLEDINLTREQFYEKLSTEGVVLTSQPSPANVTDLWDEILKDFEEIVYIPMSSGLSGSCQTAMMLADDYDGKVQVVNNQRISVTQRRSVEDAVALAEAGKSAAEIRQILEEVKFESSIYIMLDTLHYLKKGGRITPAAAAIGSLLKLKPVLQIKGERLDAFSKARSSSQGKSTMINAMRADIENKYGGTASETVYLYAVHANVPEQEEIWYQEVQAAFPNFEVRKDVLSLSVSCHTGPGALAIACSKKLDPSYFQ